MTVILDTEHPASETVSPARPNRLGVLTSRFAPNLVDVTVLGICIAVFTWRYRVMAQGGEPSGIDFGNWLTFGHAWLGHPVPNGTASTYPPIVPVLSVALTHLLGVARADWVLASALGLAPGLGVFGVLRAAGRGWWAALLGGAVIAGSASGEAVAWGGLPQLLGLALAAMCVWLAARLLNERTARRAWGLGASLLILGLTSHLVLTQAVAAMAVTVLAYALTHPRHPRDWAVWGRRGWLALAARVALLPALLTPLYLILLSTVGRSFADQQSSSFEAFLTSITGAFREAPIVWKAALLVSLAAPALTWRSRTTPLWTAAVGLWGSEVVLVALQPEQRLVYLLPLCTTLGLGLLVAPPTVTSGAPDPDGESLTTPAATLMILAAVLSSYSAVSALRGFSAQHTFYGTQLVASGTVEGLTWLREHTPPTALIATAPERGVPYGWWVEGYARRATLVGSADEFLNFPEERRRAREAVILFDDPDLLGAANLRAARHEGVDYLVIPSGWEGLSSRQLQQWGADAPDVVFQNSAMFVIRVPTNQTVGS